MFDASLFAPKNLELQIISTESTYYTTIRPLKIINHFLVIANYSCFDSFSHQVPETQLPVIIVDIKLSWGGNEFIIIDNYKVLLKNNFTEDIISLDGLQGYSKILIKLSHDISIQPIVFNHAIPNYNLVWSKRLGELKPSEAYCVRLLTPEFSQLLILSFTIWENNSLFEYYKTLVRYSEIGNYNLFREKVFLAKVFLCHNSLPYDDRLKIYVDPLVDIIKFEFSEKSSGFINLIEYRKNNDLFELKSKSPAFIIDKLKIKSKELTQDMVESRTGMLIYSFRRLITPCRVRIPENMDNLDLSHVEFHIVGRIILYKSFISVDTSSKRSHIFKVKFDKMNERKIRKNCE